MDKVDFNLDKERVAIDLEKSRKRQLERKKTILNWRYNIDSKLD